MLLAHSDIKLASSQHVACRKPTHYWPRR